MTDDRREASVADAGTDDTTEVPDEDTTELEPVPAPPPDAGDLIHPEDADDEWRSGPQKKGIRLALPTLVLSALVVLAIGFWGGSVAEKHHNPPASSTLSSLAGRFAARAGAAGAGGSAAGAGGFGAGGFGAGAGTGTRAGAAATGIVTGVQGGTLYITEADGSLVKVTPDPSATITQSTPTPLTGLTTGNTVIVRGTKNADGSVTATGITSTPASAAGGGGTGAAGG